jgi:hypothetical protein
MYVVGRSDIVDQQWPCQRTNRFEQVTEFQYLTPEVII